MRPLIPLSACLISLLLAFTIVSPGIAQCRFLLDFDDDGSPYTIRTEVPAGVTAATARFVLEITDPPPWTTTTTALVTEGCCDFFYDGYYGVRLDWDSLEFDPAIVDGYAVSIPT